MTKKTVLTVALALLLTLLLAGTALAEKDGVYVNGVFLYGNGDYCYWTNGTSSASDGSNGWNAYWDNDSHTLTLKNAQITTAGEEDGGVYYKYRDLTIELKGDNTIGSSVAPIEGAGIYVDEQKLDIEGPGSLEIYAKADGILADKHLDLNDCQIDGITAGYSGMRSDYIDMDGCTVDEIVSTGDSPAHAAIYAYEAINITDSLLDNISGIYYGIYCAYGMITFDNAQVHATASTEYGGAVFTNYHEDKDDEGIVLSGVIVKSGGQIVPFYSVMVGGAAVDKVSGTQSGDFGSFKPQLCGWTFSEDDRVEFGMDGNYDGLASLDVELVAIGDLELGAVILAAAGQSFPFVDVPAGHWAYQYIFDAYKQNLINGKTSTLYAPDGNLTYAEAIKLAACIHQLQTVGSVTTQPEGSDPWYAPYVAYAELNGIINQAQYASAYHQPVTRYDFALIFSQAMPDGYYTPLHQISSIADVPAGNAYYAYVLKLYKAGILNGSDAAGNFNGMSSIKRCEVAAIIMRMVDAEQRL